MTDFSSNVILTLILPGSCFNLFFPKKNGLSLIGTISNRKKTLFLIKERILFFLFHLEMILKPVLKFACF